MQCFNSVIITIIQNSQGLVPSSFQYLTVRVRFSSFSLNTYRFLAETFISIPTLCGSQVIQMTSFTSKVAMLEIVKWHPGRIQHNSSRKDLYLYLYWFWAPNLCYGLSYFSYKSIWDNVFYLFFGLRSFWECWTILYAILTHVYTISLLHLKSSRELILDLVLFIIPTFTIRRLAQLSQVDLLYFIFSYVSSVGISHLMFSQQCWI